ncbi:Uncharacterized protein dnm_078110 [Desulfonema magnum]|uniref:Uncharacterized protein n=1 Tax=Desulfonema magnum TaxID=45655 RepID=A0A975GSB4_9BACT|nr:Uncharacterized protein dnm_078110 [Desulfonema magnum]
MRISDFTFILLLKCQRITKTLFFVSYGMEDKHGKYYELT